MKEKPEGYVFGRPTKYKSEYCEQLIEAAENGKSFNQWAATLRVSRSTAYLWAKENPDFSDAVRLADEIHEAYMEEMGKEALYAKDFNNRVWELIMKCKHKWRDRDNPNNVIVAIDSNSDADKVAEIAKKIRKNVEC